MNRCALVILSLMQFAPLAVAQDIPAENKKPVYKTAAYKIEVGASRIIYHEKDKGAVLTITNPQDFPVLVQSQLTNIDNKAESAFMVTPPLFRLEANQKGKVKIVKILDSLPADREFMQWLCVQAIPPKDDEDSNGDIVQVNVSMSLSLCNKILYRPDSIKGTPVDDASKITWESTGKSVIAKNPTPFYMNLHKVSIDGKAISEPGYIAPFSQVEYKNGNVNAGRAEWSIINDYGGHSDKFTSTVTK